MALCKIEFKKDGKTNTPQKIVFNGVSCGKVFARHNPNDAYILVFNKNGGINMARSKIAAGNWKMNPATLGEAVELAQQIKTQYGSIINDGEECILFVPSCFVIAVADVLRDTNIKVGVQLISAESSGAYTGQISASQIASCGASWVIVGHSEVRNYLYDDANAFRSQISLAMQSGMNVIYCVGENLEEHESNVGKEVVRMQLTSGLYGMTADQVSNMVIAYEPVWAIGTGKTATADQANEMCCFIRQRIIEIYGQETGEKVTICYGGSVKPSNAAEIVSGPDIDGALMGGVSLKPADFIATINSMLYV